MEVKFQDVCSQFEYAESDYQPIPKKNKKYSYFDDGKINTSRHSFMKILDVIPFEEASFEIVDYWEKMKKTAPWVFKEETDYFIIGFEVKQEELQVMYTTLFARDKTGGWYGFRTDSPDNWWTGQLVTNPYFNYEEFKKEVANAGW